MASEGAGHTPDPLAGSPQRPPATARLDGPGRAEAAPPDARAEPQAVEPGTLTVPGARLRVATANLYVRMPARRFAADLARIVADQPDVITLQETVGRRRALLDVPGYRAWRPRGPAEAQDTTVLWRTDRWRAVRRGSALMHDEPVKWGTRYAAWVTLRSASGTVVSVVSAHASPGGPLRPGLQRVFVRALNELTGRLAERGAVVVGADLNIDYRTSPVITSWLARAGTRSTYDVLGQPDGGWATSRRGGTIDYVLVRGADVLGHATADLNSDHRLVTAEVLVPPRLAPLPEPAVR